MNKAEKELKQVKERLEHLLAASPAVIYTCRPQGDFGATFVSENITRQLGYKPDDFISDSSFWKTHIHPDDKQHILDELPNLFKNGHLVHEYRFLDKAGNYRWMHDELHLMRDDQGNPLEIIGAWYDVTEYKQSEKERENHIRLENLAQMHRLHIAGEFAALLAHQLNQPLTAIRSFAEAGLAHLRRGKLNQQLMRDTLQDVVAQSERAAGSIRDLRKFLARQPLEMMKADINAEVNAACSLMDVLMRGRKIKVSLNLAKKLPKVSMRTSQIEQIIVNLIENAMDSINHADPNGGTIEISTKLDEGKQGIVIAVRDSGPGLNDNIVGQVFDPLYTTKKNGIGMGLAISRSIVADHGGHIWAEPGPGGRFFFTLPVQK